jgi:hypothetical protein
MNKQSRGTSATRTKARRARRADASATVKLPALALAAGAKGFRQALDILGDADETSVRRLEALRVLQAATFADQQFDAVRSDYTDTLRTLIHDEQPELRQRALGLLSRSRDDFAQSTLLEGLRHPEKAVVGPADALGYLSFNLHVGVQSVARELFKQSTDNGVREQALRVMASDPASRSIIRTALADKKEPISIRQMSAAALHALDPQALQDWAGEAVLDKNEPDDIVATGLTAINQFGNATRITGNAALRKRIGEMRTKGSGRMKRLAKSIAAKHQL